MSLPAWKIFEQDLEDYFNKRAEGEPLIGHRFYDTRSAGDFLPAQPGDLLVVSRGRSILLEAKYSSVHPSLKSCFASSVTDNQIGFHRAWQRAQASTFFVFKSAAEAGSPVFELWDGKALVKARREKQRLRNIWRLRVGGSLHEILSEIYLNTPNGRILLI